MNKKCVAGYIWVSTTEQVKHDLSLLSQRRQIEEKAKAIGAEVVEFFATWA